MSAGPLVLLAAASRRVLFSFADPAITESSGLVDLGSLMVTTNDSGDDPLVFVVDSADRADRGAHHLRRPVARRRGAGPRRPGRRSGSATSATTPSAPTSVRVYRVAGRAGRSAGRRAVVRAGLPRRRRTTPSPWSRLRTAGSTSSPRACSAARRTPRRGSWTRVDRTGCGRSRRWTSGPPTRRCSPTAGTCWCVATTPRRSTPFPGFRPVGVVRPAAPAQGRASRSGRSGRIRLSSEGRHTPVLQVALPAAVRSSSSPSAPPPLWHPSRHRRCETTSVPADAAASTSSWSWSYCAARGRCGGWQASSSGVRGSDEAHRRPRATSPRSTSTPWSTPPTARCAAVAASTARSTGRAARPCSRTACSRFPHGLATGQAGWTTAGDLPARWVIHVVGPNYAAGERDRGLLTSCYANALACRRRARRPHGRLPAGLGRHLRLAARGRGRRRRRDAAGHPDRGRGGAAGRVRAPRCYDAWSVHRTRAGQRILRSNSRCASSSTLARFHPSYRVRSAVRLSSASTT